MSRTPRFDNRGPDGSLPSPAGAGYPTADDAQEEAGHRKGWTKGGAVLRCGMSRTAGCPLPPAASAQSTPTS